MRIGKPIGWVSLQNCVARLTIEGVTTQQSDSGPATTGDDPDALISMAVYKLLEARDETIPALAFHTGISIASLYRKLNHDVAWKAQDIMRVARHFGVEPNDLFSGNPIPRPRRISPRASVPTGADPRQAASRDTHRYVHLIAA